MSTLVFSRRLSKQEIRELEPFHGLTLDRIRVVHNDSELCDFSRKVLSSNVLGFDTETRPSFQPGSTPHPVSLVQFASANGAVLFKLSGYEPCDEICRLLSSEGVQKVGFGLKQDKQQIYRQFGVELRNTHDLGGSFTQFGIKQKVGAQAAIAMAFGLRLQKSKKIQLSNWASPTLSDSQILYAANDAYSAYEVYRQLSLN